MAFAAWERAWRGDDGADGVLLVDLLWQEPVAVIAAIAEGRVSAGAVVSRTSEVVGISNFFAEPGDAPVADEIRRSAVRCRPGARDFEVKHADAEP